MKIKIVESQNLKNCVQNDNKPIHLFSTLIFKTQYIFYWTCFHTKLSNILLSHAIIHYYYDTYFSFEIE